MKYNLLRFFIVPLFFAFLFSCQKTNVLNGAGINVISFPAYANVYSYDLVAGTQTFSILTIQRDIPSNAVLNTSQTVTVQLDTNVINTYNTANSSSYKLLAPSAYTFDASNPLTAGNVVITFAPGEYSKVIKINLDLTQLPAGNNAIGFTITQTTLGVISNQSSHAFVAVGAKNRFDGEYTLTGTMIDNYNGALTGNYPVDVFLISNGPLQAQMYDNSVPGLYHSILNAGSLSYYGALGVVFNFNTDNSVASVVNLYGQPASNTRFLTLDPSGVNTWDPVTKTLKVRYWMDQPSKINGHRTSFDETYTFKGPR